MKNQRKSTTSLLPVLLLFATCAMAATSHDDPGLAIDDHLELADLLEETLARHPAGALPAARRQTAEAESRYGDRWFPEAAELSAYHMSDRPLDDTGVYENEAAISLPLWLPGEKRAQAALGEATMAEQGSYSARLHWQVSGLLREQAWQLSMARRRFELALEQEKRLESLLEQVALFAEVGDVSRSDLLSTTQELALWRAETLGLEAEYQDAVREFRALTGSAAFPAGLDEPLSDRASVDDSHPAIRAALDRVASASARAGAAAERNSVRPSVNVFWREFRGERTTPDSSALGIGFSIPLGKSPSRRPEIAQAHEALAEADAGLRLTRRELDLQLHEARHELHTIERQLENSKAMMTAATERHRLDRLAFELGDISVRQWLRRLSETRRIEQSHELLLLQHGAAIAAYNQAAGESL